jgi:hypothetical protein
MQLPSGRGKVNAWGENHLWLRYRKGSKLSGLVEPRISAALALRVSNNPINTLGFSSLNPTYKKWRRYCYE